MIVELVDDKLEDFLSFIEQSIYSGMSATMGKIQMKLYRGNSSSKPDSPSW